MSMREALGAATVPVCLIVSAVVMAAAVAPAVAPAAAAAPADTALSPPEHRSPGLGRAADQATLTAFRASIGPDGAGLPPGSGDATSGAPIYAQQCQSCHGPEGRGGPNGALVGGRGSLTSEEPLKTVGSYWPYATTVFDYVRRAMPYHAPGTLSDDEVYAVTAYLLHHNGIIGPEQEMNRQTLPQVVMPNRDGFRVSPRRF